MGRDRIATLCALKYRTRVWNKATDRARRKIDWRLTTADARRVFQYRRGTTPGPKDYVGRITTDGLGRNSLRAIPAQVRRRRPAPVCALSVLDDHDRGLTESGHVTHRCDHRDTEDRAA
jgi:hypothetical protein